MGHAQDSTNLQPPHFGPQFPTYPILQQFVRVIGAALGAGSGSGLGSGSGSGMGVGLQLFPAVTEQYTGLLSLRDRELCYVLGANGEALDTGRVYHSRLWGSFGGLPLYGTSTEGGFWGLLESGGPGGTYSFVQVTFDPGPLLTPDGISGTVLAANGSEHYPVGPALSADSGAIVRVYPAGTTATGSPAAWVFEDLEPFREAGVRHSQGAVPDPGFTAHTIPYYLGDDGTWHLFNDPDCPQVPGAAYANLPVSTAPDYVLAFKDGCLVLVPVGTC